MSGVLDDSGLFSSYSVGTQSLLGASSRQEIDIDNLFAQAGSLGVHEAPGALLATSSLSINDPHPMLQRNRKVVSVATPDLELHDFGRYVAQWLVALFAELTATGQVWMKPHVTFDEGEYAFEWWRADRKLTAYIKDFQVQLLAVWGADMDTEMRTFDNPGLSTLLDVWDWLITNQERHLTDQMPFVSRSQ